MWQLRGLVRRHGVRLAVVSVLACCAVVIGMNVRAGIGPSEAATVAGRRTYVCAETGKAFAHTLVPGEGSPVTSPYTHRPTGYPAEWCYWSADGQLKPVPTPVLLNTYRGRAGPTFCPDCGRLVVAHNPRPEVSGKPPPTRGEYEAAHVARVAGR